MDVLSYVLEGLEQWLEVERECGVRTLEVDRSLLSPAAKPTPEAASAVVAGSSAAPSPSGSSGAPRPPASPGAPAAMYDFVFLHDRPLPPAGIEMMAKIVTAMKKTAETAPIVFNGERPAAKAYVLLGSGALRKWLPGVKGAPGEWVKDQAGNGYLVTYSPEFILRMGPPTPAVKEIKMKMWTSLKGVMQRVVSR